jgi:protein SCO1/2
MSLSPEVTLPARRNLLVPTALLGLLVALGLGGVLALRQPPQPPLPDLGTLPAFTLTDQDGRASGLAELRGQVWVADFVFTRCPTICPLLTSRMAQIEKRTQGLTDVRLVSVTVDPDYDTPAVLTRYMQKHGIAAGRWRFLTGSTARIEEVVTRGFKEVLERDGKTGPDDFLSIVHGGHFVLVDRAGHIRGYYDSSEPSAVDAVVRDAARLHEEPLRDSTHG